MSTTCCSHAPGPGLAVLATLASVSAYAQDTGMAPPLAPDAFAIGSNLLGVTVNLVLVLAAIVILAWLFRRVQGLGQPAEGSLRVAATLPLGPKERILLLQVGDEQLVVGASPAGLRTLHVLAHPLALDDGHGEGDPAQSFRARLGAALARAQS